MGKAAVGIATGHKVTLQRGQVSAITALANGQYAITLTTCQGRMGEFDAPIQAFQGQYGAATPLAAAPGSTARPAMSKATKARLSAASKKRWAEKRTLEAAGATATPAKSHRKKAMTAGATA